MALDLPTNNKHWKEKFIFLRRLDGFRVGLTWRVVDGSANIVTEETIRKQRFSSNLENYVEY